MPRPIPSLSRAPWIPLPPKAGLLVVQDAAPSAGGSGDAGGSIFDGERIARLSLHGVQLVMLLALLVCEVRRLRASRPAAAFGRAGRVRCGSYRGVRSSA